MRAATVFNFLIEATLTGSIMILLMLPVRRYLRSKLSSRLICFAWLLIALRLLLPLSLPNPIMNELRPALSGNMGVRPIADQVRVRTADAVRELAITASQHDGTHADALSETLWHVTYDLSSGHVAKLLLVAYVSVALAVTGWMTWRNARFCLCSSAGGLRRLTEKGWRATSAVQAARDSARACLLGRSASGSLPGRGVPPLYRSSPDAQRDGFSPGSHA